jgi:putative ABC transport system permease protein
LKFIQLTWESVRFALGALRSNLLRTILSLLGVTIGIFAIIGVFTMVDSLEKNIKESFSFLGANIIRVDRFPFVFDSPDFPWWEYFRRPAASYDEYLLLQANLKSAEAVTLFAERSTLIKNDNNSIQGQLTGVSWGYQNVYDLEIESGRFFNQQEIEAGRNVAIIGTTIAETLFPFTDAMGQELTIRGQRYTVIGIFKKEGESFLGVTSKDEGLMVPFRSFRKIYNTTGRFGVQPVLSVRGRDTDIGLIELENEMTGLLRSKRGLKPKDRNNFELNRPEAVAEAIGKVFDVIGIAGWVIGGFSILVGGFGIANIMFVSVKERTNIIGIQKSLGAKNFFILFQFLFESIFLSLIGGGAGILLVWLLTFIPFGTLEVALSFQNVLLGLVVSMAVGTASGIIPAAMAARLDPVEAIRSN